MIVYVNCPHCQKEIEVELYIDHDDHRSWYAVDKMHPDCQCDLSAEEVDQLQDEAVAKAGGL